ncbi:hypothetical protein ES703_64497 [subsurface metagenome]
MYLLSAEAQVLGALFALVFSITLIATQFVTKYTHRTMQIIFNKWVIGYMILFAGSIIVPLACLSNPSGLGSFISFVYGSVMIILLIPFFLDLKRRMNIGWIITHLKKECINAFEDQKVGDNIEALDNIAMGAYGEHNYDVFALAVAALADLNLDVNQKQLLDILGRLRETCEELIDNPRALRIIVEKLGKVGASAIEERLQFPDSTKKILRENYAINIIRIVYKGPKKESRDRLLLACVVALADMAEAAKRYKDKEVEKNIADIIEDVFKYFKDTKTPESWYNKAKNYVSSLA